MPGTTTQSFFYDGVDRLVRATGSGTLGSNKTTTFELSFGYSASDNLLQKTSSHAIINNNGSTVLPVDTNYASPYTYAPERPHLPTQIGTLAITYDPSGNPTTRTRNGTVQELIWDDDNRLVQAQGMGANQRNLYDADGRRILRHGRGNTIFSSEYFEYDNAATGTKHIFAGELRVASVLARFQSGENPAPPTKQGTPFYFHDNHLGSAAVVTTQSGEVNDAHEYFPDGAEWIVSGKGGTVDGFLFQGKPLDPDTNFYDFGQRFYDPTTSLWLGIDDAFTDDPSSVVGKHAGLALIAFTANNPLRFIDPDGREPRGVACEAPSCKLAVAVNAKLARSDTLATTAEALVGKLTWSGPSQPDPDYDWQIKTTSTRLRNDLHGYEDTENNFAKWVRGGPVPTDSSKMNCWEAILFAGYRSGVISKDWITSVHAEATFEARAEHSGIAYQEVLKKRLGYAHSAPLKPGIAVNRGDLVFFDGLSHVALATGRTVVGPGGTVKHEVISLWILPGSPGHLNSKTQRTTIEDIKNSVDVNMPQPTKEIRVGSNPW